MVLRHFAVACLSVALGYALLSAVPRSRERSTEDAAVQPLQALLEAEVAAAAPGRLANAIACATVGDKSAPNHVENPEPFRKLHEHLEASFPLVYEKLQHERVCGWVVGWVAIEQLPACALSTCQRAAAASDSGQYDSGARCIAAAGCMPVAAADVAAAQCPRAVETAMGRRAWWAGRHGALERTASTAPSVCPCAWPSCPAPFRR